MNDITPLILTYNESPNIERTLQGLTWAKSVVVIDSFSSDDTLVKASHFPNVRIIQRTFDNHTSQWNYGLDQIQTDWVLTLDADYVLDASFAKEIVDLTPDRDAYFARFQYCLNGKPLRSTLYPPRCVLFRKSLFRYKKDGHTQWLDVSINAAGMLENRIAHDDRKPLSDWLRAQTKYAKLEAEKLLSKSQLSWKDRIRQYIVLAPLLTFVYCYFFKLLILDGRPGLYYSLQRTYAELLLGLELLDHAMHEKS